ncbi:hypothetical protein FHW84_002799 [Dyella sp. SG562]|uniref:hypothetical protein n=1 Tax=Dyella sp. SG562 TaxID=2587017 RepID=UPI0014214877|nr:hypothetical protein [Dyella sp. SG562]NII74214.1 hypothetical protein [Dyella sp. SG562]
MNDLVKGLLTILTSGLVSASATTLFNFCQSERQIRRNKLEEVCVATIKSIHVAQEIRRNFDKIFDSGVSAKQMDELLQKIGSMVGDDVLRINTLTSLYFPEVYPLLLNCSKSVADLNATSPTDREKMGAAMDRVIADRGEFLRGLYRLAPQVNAPIWKAW